MPFVAAQTAAFFTDGDQMALIARTVTQLQTEGITAVDDLAEFEEDDFKQLVTNLKHPPQIPDPANAANLIHDVPYVLGAKSLRRLKVAATAIRYYQSVDRATTPNSMHYTNTLKHFEEQWNALVKRSDDTAPDVPVVTRNLKITRWSEAFVDFLHRVNGVRHCPLVYVIRPDSAVPAPPALLRNRPYSAEHGSVEGEMIARLSHNHALFRDDNAKVYHYLEEATRGTIYASSLKPFQRRKDGREAHLAIINQHAGVDKWEDELKAQEEFLKTRVWKGNTNFALEKFTDQHRSAFISMEQCAQHVNYQLPNEHTRVRYLLDAIVCQDAELLAAKAVVKSDKVGPTARRNHFENCVAELLPACPVKKKRKLNDRNNNSTANISALGGNDGGGKDNIKPSIGKTGVHFRYYPKNEYKKLEPAQKKELKEWREKNDPNYKKRKGSDKTKDNNDNKKLRSAISSVMKEEKEKEAKAAAENEAEISLLKAAMLEMNKATASSTQSSVPITEKTATVMATHLQGIMKRHSNGKKTGGAPSE